MRVSVNGDDTSGYEVDTVLEIPGRHGRIHHTDHNRLQLVAPPVPDPKAT